jgi:glycerophosphoryl diester phosphodiesterase
MSRDEIPVLHHDWSIPGTGRRRHRISDFSLQELLECDKSTWFKDGYDGECILTLEQLLDLYCERTRLLIEIKSHERDRRSDRNRVLTRRVLDLLKERVPGEHEENIAILSFDPAVLELAHEEEPRWTRVLNVSRPWPAGEAGQQRIDHLDALCLPIRHLSADFVRTAHDGGRKVMTYSCNTAMQVRRAETAGADVIMTDEPRWLVEHLHKRGLR